MEKDATTPEDVLNRQLATCLAAMQDCLQKSRAPCPDNDVYDRARTRNLDQVATLMKASAELTLALAKLKGETSHNIHVTRQAGDKG